MPTTPDTTEETIFEVFYFVETLCDTSTCNNIRNTKQPQNGYEVVGENYQKH